MGFETKVRTDDYAFCARGGGALRFVRLPPGADPTDEAYEVSAYIEARDVDAYWSDYEQAILSLPEGHRRAPFNQPYGQREFHLIHGPCLFFVGQLIVEAT